MEFLISMCEIVRISVVSWRKVNCFLFWQISNFSVTILKTYEFIKEFSTFYIQVRGRTC